MNNIIIQKKLYLVMIQLNMKNILSFIVIQLVLAMMFYINDNFISGTEAILSVPLSIILTIYFSWLVKKDDDQYDT